MNSATTDLATPWRWDDKKFLHSDIEIKKERAKKYDCAAVVFTAEQVEARILELAQIQAAVIAKEEPLDRTYVSILNGAVPFSSKLGQAIAVNHTGTSFMMRYIDTSRFGNSQTGRQELSIHSDYHPADIDGKDVTLVDEVSDEMITMTLNAQRLKGGIPYEVSGETVAAHAKTVSGLVLTDKEIATPDMELFTHFHRGLIIPKIWVCGVGLDSPGEVNRWSPDIMLSRSQRSAYRGETEKIVTVLGPTLGLTIDDFVFIDD